jgi:glutamate N-acetyltransferase/amino-acid N-acetyltransferase
VKIDRRPHRVRVPGFRFAGVRAGFKSAGPDVALVVADEPAVVAGVLTTNRAPAAPVIVTRARLRRPTTRAVLVNAGNANAGTGARGRRDAETATALVAAALGVPPGAVLACSTGRIGVPLRMAIMRRGVAAAVAELSRDGFAAAAEAIRTTDAFAKTAVRGVPVGGARATIAVMAKGAGMIHPGLATLLAFVTTDAALTPGFARAVLRKAVAPTLNATTVDGDMSTNDTVLLLASGRAGHRTLDGRGAASRAFAAALTDALDEIARLIVLDGEGATKVVEVAVRGARSARAADRVARAIATSTLCKCAFHGGDPNWGRFVCAAGTAGVPIDQERIDVLVDDVAVSRAGAPVAGALARAQRRMARPSFRITLDLHQGRAVARVLTADLSVAYVRFNAEYTT